MKTPKTMWAVINPEDGHLCAVWQLKTAGWMPLVMMGKGPDGDELPEALRDMGRAAATKSGRTVELVRYGFVRVAERIVP